MYKYGTAEQLPHLSELPASGQSANRQPVPGCRQSAVTDSLSLGDLPWQEIFQDTLLQQYIRYGLEHNTDMQTALLRVDQAKAQLTAAKLSFLPLLTLSPQGTLTSTAGSKTVKTYELPVQASWEIDLFGNLRNAKKGTQATLLQQQAYQQAVRSELIAGIANTYYSLLMLDEQVAISQSTLEVWKEQVKKPRMPSPKPVPACMNWKPPTTTCSASNGKPKIPSAPCWG